MWICLLGEPAITTNFKSVSFLLKKKKIIDISENLPVLLDELSFRFRAHVIVTSYFFFKGLIGKRIGPHHGGNILYITKMR